MQALFNIFAEFTYQLITRLKMTDAEHDSYEPCLKIKNYGKIQAKKPLINLYLCTGVVQ